MPEHIWKDLPHYITILCTQAQVVVVDLSQVCTETNKMIRNGNPNLASELPSAIGWQFMQQ